MNDARAAEFRKVGMIGAAVGLGSAGMLPLMEKHPRFAIAWLCVLAVMMVYVVAQLVRIRKAKRARRTER